MSYAVPIRVETVSTAVFETENSVCAAWHEADDVDVQEALTHVKRSSSPDGV